VWQKETWPTSLYKYVPSSTNLDCRKTQKLRDIR